MIDIVTKEKTHAERECYKQVRPRVPQSDRPTSHPSRHAYPIDRAKDEDQRTCDYCHERQPVRNAEAENFFKDETRNIQ